MFGGNCMTGMVVGALVRFEVDGKIYEGEVKMLSDGTMTAVGDFKPVKPHADGEIVGGGGNGTLSPFALEVLGGMGEFMQSKERAIREDANSAMVPIRHSWKCFWSEKEGSDKILDPVWLDIGCVSVATAYHPKCGKVSFVARPQLSTGDCDWRVVSTYSIGLDWKDCECSTLGHAKNCIADAWSAFCAQHEPTIKPEPEWLQVKSVWVCEYNGWAACLRPSATVSNNGENPTQLYVCEAWKIDDMRKKRASAPAPLQAAKRFILGFVE